MASRTSWEGYLRLNLLSVPVKAYNADASGSGKIHFHQLHAECHSRIRYKKVCPIHGEVPNDDIISGYEFAKGKYAVVDQMDLEKLHPENDKTIGIDVFIRPGDLDPIYYGDRSYFVVPDGKVAQKPYAVLQRVMAERGRYAIAKMVLSGREQLVLLRPVEGLMALTVLNFEDQLKKPSEFEDEVSDVAISAKERELAESLVDASTARHFDLSQYKDTYTQELAKVLEAKSEGKSVAEPRAHEEPVVVNLMDALRKSLDHAKKSTTGTKAAPERATKSRVKTTKPRTATARGKSRAAAPKRKTG